MYLFLRLLLSLVYYMSGKHSKKLTYRYSKLYLNDGTHSLNDQNYYEVKPTYTGDLKYSVNSQDHNGWLRCDGRSISRNIYPKLFNIIGTAFGSVDSNTFNLPDCRGKVLGVIGNGVGGLSSRALGDTVGTETHTLTSAEMPTHSHTGTSDVSGIHTHTGTTDLSGTHTHTSNATGGQGNYGLVLANGANTVIDTDSSVGELNVWTTPGALTINSSGSHVHTFTSNSSGSHTHTFTTNTTGNSQAHNNMQPTIFISNVFVYAM